MKTEVLLLWRNIRALPAPVWYLSIGVFINRFGSFVIPFLAIYLKTRGFAGGEIKLVLLSFGAGMLGAVFMGGYFADRFGRRNTIAGAMLWSTVCMLAMSQADTLALLCPIAFLTSLGGGVYHPASNALIADMVEPENRVTAYALYRWAVNFGFTMGPVTAGFLMEVSYVAIFIGNALACLVFAVIAFAKLPHGVSVSKAESAWAPAWADMRKNTEFWRLFASSFLVGLVFFQVMSVFSLHVAGEGFLPHVYGMLMGLNALLVMMLEIPLTVFTKRFDLQRVIAVGFSLVGIGMSLTLYAHTLPMLVAVIVVFSMGEIVSMPWLGSYVASLAPDKMRGRYMGVHSLSFSSAHILAPWIGIDLLEHQPSALWMGCAVLGFASAAFLLVPRSRAGSPAPAPVAD